MQRTDVNGHGIDDLVVKVETKELQIGDDHDKAVLIGSLVDASSGYTTPFEGEDVIRMVP